jgi:5,5'-dehydrodivanillate O-demethylase
VEERGIACAYHGWLYDTAGNCLECPAEPGESKFHLTVKHRAYPVAKLMGLYWAYLGPPPAPPLRRLDIGAYPLQRITVMPHDANWIQALENNGLDSTHIFILHQDTGGRRGPASSTTRGRIGDLKWHDFVEEPFGIRWTMMSGDDYLEDDLVVFPNLLRRVNQIQIHAPIDDTHTRLFKLYFSRDRDGFDADLETEPVDYFVQQAEELKSGPGVHPDVGYRMNELGYQDIMAIETQGGIAPRPDWHLATSDRGIVLFERMLLREMDRVEEGHDPLGVVRDSNQAIDTHYEYFRQQWHDRLTQVVPQGVQVYAQGDGNGSAAHGSAPQPGPVGARA